MKLRIEINLDNSAFYVENDEGDEEFDSNEVERILRSQLNNVFVMGQALFRDVNGNTVGYGKVVGKK